MSEYDDIINDPNYTYGLDQSPDNAQSIGVPSRSGLAMLPPSNGGGQASGNGLRQVTPDQKRVLQKLYTQSRYADPHQINLAVHQIEHAIETSDPSKPLPVPLQATLNAINELGIGDYDYKTTMDMPDYLSTVGPSDKCNAFPAWQYSKAGVKMGGGNGYPVSTILVASTTRCPRMAGLHRAVRKAGSTRSSGQMATHDPGSNLGILSRLDLKIQQPEHPRGTLQCMSAGT